MAVLVGICDCRLLGRRFLIIVMLARPYLIYLGGKCGCHRINSLYRFLHNLNLKVKWRVFSKSFYDFSNRIPKVNSFLCRFSTDLYGFNDLEWFLDIVIALFLLFTALMLGINSYFLCVLHKRDGLDEI